MHTENEAAGRPRVDLEAQLQGLPTILLMCILIHTLSQTCQKREGLSLLGEAGGVGEKDTSRCAASREQCADRKEEGGECDDECVAARIMMRRTNAAKSRRDRQSQKEDGIIPHANDRSFTAEQGWRFEINGKTPILDLLSYEKQ